VGQISSELGLAEEADHYLREQHMQQQNQYHELLQIREL
jgi:hypothetical protein